MSSVLSINTSSSSSYKPRPGSGSSPSSSPRSSPLSGIHSTGNFNLDGPSVPTGGILLNKVIPPHSDPVPLGLEVPSSAFAGGFRRGSIGPDQHGILGGGKYGIAAGIASMIPPSSAAVPYAVALPTSPSLTNKRSSLTESPPLPLSANPAAPVRTPSSTKIRFAPLPTPRRQRALSTGRNIQAKASLSSDGTRRAEWRAKIDSDPPWSRVGATEDDEEAVEDESPDEDDASAKMSWMDVGTWGKAEAYSKLLKPLRAPSFSGGGRDEPLGRRESRDSMIDPSALSTSFGAPLRKSISTGGMIGSSPFRFSIESDRRRSLVGISTGGRRSNKHNRAGSVDKPDFSSLSASLGRPSAETIDPSASSVGARPVKMLNGRVYGSRRASAPEKPAEPVFNEWNGMMGGSTSGGMGSVVSKNTSADDAEDDGSGMGWVKRRREARERERRESELANSHTDAKASLSQPTSSSVFPNSIAPDAASPAPAVVITQADHQAIAVPTYPGGVHSRRHDGPDPGDDTSSDEEEEEDDDEGEGDPDFESDDEDEVLEEEQKARTTSSAAGVEVISRHKE